MTEKDKNGANREIDQMPDDDLNVKIGVLTRREVEARILAPVIDALSKNFGQNNVMNVVRQTITGIAAEQGAKLAEHMGGNTLQHFADSLRYWTQDNALEIEIIEQSEEAFWFNVTRCRYAELYKNLGVSGYGTIFSCARDFALIKGFNGKINLKRTQTIMEGAVYCDFRYSVKKGN
ncbi:MAG: L-2-amino-thiazoline-4-carboxylic acid hydrolase [Desulfobacterales bacterium]